MKARLCWRPQKRKRNRLLQLLCSAVVLAKPFPTAVCTGSRLCPVSQLAGSGGEASEALVPGAEGPSPCSAASPWSCQTPWQVRAQASNCDPLRPGRRQLPGDALQDCRPKSIPPALSGCLHRALPSRTKSPATFLSAWPHRAEPHTGP